MLFSATLKEQWDHLSPLDALKGVREKAWHHFTTLGLPERKQEAFQYVPLNQLYSAPFCLAPTLSLSQEEILSHIYPECRHSFLVFINGSFQETLSDYSGLPPQVVISPLSLAMKSYGHILQQRFLKSLSEEKDAFASLNMALHPQGAFVFIPPQLKLSVPIQCLFVNLGTFAYPRLHIFVGSGAHVQWISRLLVKEGTPSWTNGVTDIALDEGAHFHHTSLLQSPEWHFASLRASLKRNSQFHSVSLTTGGKVVRQDYRVSLNGQEAKAFLKEIGLLNGQKQAHTHVLMEHLAPHCHSMQHFKGVVEGTSHSSFEGKIFVHQKAQKTEAYQLNNHLLLSDLARVASKPNLEIFADDVKASHGATISQLDEMSLFYLKTRGISSALAKSLLLNSFCKEIIDQIPHLSPRGEIGALLP